MWFTAQNSRAPKFGAVRPSIAYCSVPHIHMQLSGVRHEFFSVGYVGSQGTGGEVLDVVVEGLRSAGPARSGEASVSALVSGLGGLGNRGRSFGVHQFRPDSVPRLAAQIPPTQLPLRHGFEAPCFGWIHVAPSAQALVQVGVAEACVGGDALARLGGDVGAHDGSDRLDDRFAGLIAQDGPLNVGPQFLAQHGIAHLPCESLDRRAAFRWDFSALVAPLIDCARRHQEKPREFGLTTDYGARSKNWGRFSAHAPTVAPLHARCKALLHAPVDSIAAMATHWTPEEEAENLKRLFKRVNQAAFAREFRVPGGASMVSQHVKGRRPINMEAALAYAKGFKLTLAEISPRAAEQMSKALRELGDPMPGAAGTTTSTGSATLTVGAPIPAAPSATATVQNLADLLRAMPLAQREVVARELSLLAQVPDSAALPRSIAAALDGSVHNRRASDASARIAAAAAANQAGQPVAPPGTDANVHPIGEQVESDAIGLIKTAKQKELTRAAATRRTQKK